MHDPGRVIIIGAGPTGLAAAHRLHEFGHQDFLILDPRPTPGGLASSYVDEYGFTWDIGGHVQFSHYETYDRLLDTAVPQGWINHRRSAWIWFKKRFVPYPFQNNLRYLDEQDRERCLQGLEAAIVGRSGGEARNFKEWLEDTFGYGIAEAVLHPLNLKTWGYPLDQLSKNWIGDRVAVPDLKLLRSQIVECEDDDRWGPNRIFRYPMRGGTGAIWAGVASLIPEKHLHLGSAAVTEVNEREKIVRCGNQATYPWDTLISTMPLDILCASVPTLPTSCRLAAEELKHNSIHILGFGLKGNLPECLKGKSWMYFPMSNSPYSRITALSNYSPHMTPQGPGYWSLMVEVCESPFKPVNEKALIEDVLHALREDLLITSESRIISVWHRREEYSYPIPTLNRDNALQAIMIELEKQNIFSRGRFGGWKYEVSNQDHSAMQAIELIDRLLLGHPETIYRHKEIG